MRRREAMKRFAKRLATALASEPARTPVPHSPLAEAQGDPPSEGATVQVLPAAGQGDSGNSR
jgi:hypothetical protein